MSIIAASVCVARMGCGALDYRQQAQQMELRTGGMSVSTQVIPDSSQLDMFEQVSLGSLCVCVCVLLMSCRKLSADSSRFCHLQGILLSSSSLERNVPHMFQLWSDIFNRCVLRRQQKTPQSSSSHV